MILVVDDDKTVRLSIGLLLKKKGYEVAYAANPNEAIPYFRQGLPRVVIMDMNYGSAIDGSDGLHLLNQARIFMPDVPIILLTAWGSIDLAVAGMRGGAFDFMTKPWDNRILLTKLETALRLSSKIPDLPQSSLTFDRSGIIGRSAGLQEVLQKAAKVAQTDASVLILGENGTGKELIARAIHTNSQRRGKPFVMVNLGGISESLFESEMFGHVKGAFTGAIADRIGRFEMADEGTIFLDEIGDLSLPSQVKLLRVLQQHTFERLGESRQRRVDIRVISATNVNLEKLIKEGVFREDLFYRINLITLHLPPLRERREDIIPLADHFLSNAQKEYNLSAELTPDGKSYLESLAYPGNIRQLKNIIEHALIISGNGEINAEVLKEAGGERAGYSDLISGTSPSEEGVSAGQTLEYMERNAIVNALKKYKGNLSNVASALGITRQTLYRRLQKYEIDPEKI